MLNFFFLKKKTKNFILNNGLFDYFFKKISFFFVNIFFINLAYFFAEKYTIDFLTKKLFNIFIINNMYYYKIFS